MKNTYLKFILHILFLVYLVSSLLQLLFNMTKEHLIREKAESLYSKQSLIAGTYAGGFRKTQ